MTKHSSSQPTWAHAPLLTQDARHARKSLPRTKLRLGAGSPKAKADRNRPALEAHLAFCVLRRATCVEVEDVALHAMHLILKFLSTKPHGAAGKQSSKQLKTRSKRRDGKKRLPFSFGFQFLHHPRLLSLLSKVSIR